MNRILYFSYVLIYIFLLFWSIRIAFKFRRINLSNVIILVIISLIYENAVIASGIWIGEGNVLEALTKVRYWLHALVTPLLVFFGLFTLRYANLQWAKARWVSVVCYLLVIALILIEVVTVTSNLALNVHLQYGILTYEHTGHSTPIMVITVSVIILLTGLIIWVKQKWPWLFIATILLGIGSMMNFISKNPVWMNGLELIFMTAIVWTNHMQEQKGAT